MYTRGKIEDIQADDTTQKLLKAIWFELVEINKKLEEKQNGQNEN